MDESNLTIAEYVELMEKRAIKRGEVFDWRTANYFNIEEDDPLAYEYEEPFSAIVLTMDHLPMSIPNHLEAYIALFVATLVLACHHRFKR